MKSQHPNHRKRRDVEVTRNTRGLGEVEGGRKEETKIKQYVCDVVPATALGTNTHTSPTLVSPPRLGARRGQEKLPGLRNCVLCYGRSAAAGLCARSGNLRERPHARRAGVVWVATQL